MIGHTITEPRPLGLVERLRNGGQPDLADMAQGLVSALETLIEHADLADDSCYGTLGTSFVRDIARAAIARATGAAS